MRAEINDAVPRRSTLALDPAYMSPPDSKDTFIRIGCGAMVGVLVGMLIVVGTLVYWVNSITALVSVVALSVVVCALVGWRFGDTFFHSLHKWIGWFW